LKGASLHDKLHQKRQLTTITNAAGARQADDEEGLADRIQSGTLKTRSTSYEAIKVQTKVSPGEKLLPSSSEALVL